MASKSKAVAKQDEAEKKLAPVVYDEEDYGAGFEDFDRSDVAIPFLNILQKSSPQVDEENAAYVQGAKPGMIMNSVTQELYDKDSGVIVIPVHRVHQYIEWIPRDEGGGFVAAHDPNSDVVLKAKEDGSFGDLQTPEGNDLKETFNVFVVIVGEEDGDFGTAIIPFTSTRIRDYKKWMSTCRAITIRNSEGRRFPAPMYGHTYRARTRFQENNKGTWYGFDIKFSDGNAAESRLTPEDELFQVAKAFRELVVAGDAKINYNSSAATEPEEGTYTEEDDSDGVF